MIGILAYHSLDDSGSVLSTSSHLFAEQMKFLRDAGIRIASLNELADKEQELYRRENNVVLTFDDGFQNVYQHAFPILHTFGFSATVFLVTDYCGKANSWPGQPVGISRQPLLRWKEVEEMSRAGISFGSHTRTHPDLRKLSLHEAEEELIGSKKAISDATGKQVDTFAYPYGFYNGAVRNLVKQHFSLACSTSLGFVKGDCDPFGLERIEMYYFQPPKLFRNLFSPVTGAYLGVRKSLRRLRHAL
jgi:peptidoglycan/xylan/chitin deacetylase (PgdA/CDA1 family)